LLAQMSPGFLNPRAYYENHWVDVKESATSSRSSPRPLDRMDWRYYVLGFSGNSSGAYEFLLAANLVRPALSAFAEVHTEEKFGKGKTWGWGGDQVRSVLAYEAPHSHRLELLDTAAAIELRQSYERFVALDSKKHPGIARAVNVFHGLKRIPYGSDLRVLGLFAVIEMLLTHNPNDKELGDSLSHQISTKIPLLSERFSTPLNYGVFEDGVEAATAWKRLYAYRSKIAHGDTVEFTGGLKLLRSRQTATEFLEDATRRLVRHALDEPKLVDALKPV
jgi:hypothetical protein